MANKPSDAQSLRAIHEVFSPDELNALCQRIIGSGILGRSKNYGAMLSYLVRCSIDGNSPKELELAIDVLGRGDDFDVSVDSAVRVYMHQLRKKLDTYYQNHQQDAQYRIVIPKGSYTLAAAPLLKAFPNTIGMRSARRYFSLSNGLLAGVIILLTANLLYMFAGQDAESDQVYQVAAQHPVWESVLSDGNPFCWSWGTTISLASSMPMATSLAWCESLM